MRKKYDELELEIIFFATEDVITASVVQEDPDPNEMDIATPPN